MDKDGCTMLLFMIIRLLIGDLFLIIGFWILGFIFDYWILDWGILDLSWRIWNWRGG